MAVTFGPKLFKMIKETVYQNMAVRTTIAKSILYRIGKVCVQHNFENDCYGFV